MHLQMRRKLQICSWPYSILHQTQTTSFKVLTSTNLSTWDCCFHCSMFEVWCEMTYFCCCSFHNQISLDVDSTHPVTSTSHLELLPSLVLYTGIVAPLHPLAVWKYLLLHKLCGILFIWHNAIIIKSYYNILKS